MTQAISITKATGGMNDPLSPEQLQDVLTKHLAWLRGETQGQRAYLYGANLTGAYLYGANLYGANLTRANLTRANLYRANLTGANLTGAYLTGAYLYGANLTGAYLTGANLTRASLTGANLGKGWKVESYQDLLFVGPLGSRNDSLIYNVPTGYIRAGCFGQDTTRDLDAFAEAVKKEHGESQYGRDYLATVEYLRALTAGRVTVEAVAS